LKPTIASSGISRIAANSSPTSNVTSLNKPKATSRTATSSSISRDKSNTTNKSSISTLNIRNPASSGIPRPVFSAASSSRLPIPTRNTAKTETISLIKAASRLPTSTRSTAPNKTASDSNSRSSAKIKTTGTKVKDMAAVRKDTIAPYTKRSIASSKIEVPISKVNKNAPPKKIDSSSKLNKKKDSTTMTKYKESPDNIEPADEMPPTESSIMIIVPDFMIEKNIIDIEDDTQMENNTQTEKDTLMEKASDDEKEVSNASPLSKHGTDDSISAKLHKSDETAIYDPTINQDPATAAAAEDNVLAADHIESQTSKEATSLRQSESNTSRSEASLKDNNSKASHTNKGRTNPYPRKDFGRFASRNYGTIKCKVRKPPMAHGTPTRPRNLTAKKPRPQ
jgi:hypothetical protein